jgi:hypothetical protein
MTEREAAEQRLKTLLQGVDLELSPRQELEAEVGTVVLFEGANPDRTMRARGQGARFDSGTCGYRG